MPDAASLPSRAQRAGPPPPPESRREPGWRRELAEAIRDPGQLCRVLELPATVAAEAIRAAGDFPLLVPRGFVARMRRGDPLDPLLAQVLPRGAERLERIGFTTDPLAESAALAAPALVRKYRGRALLLVTAACAVHCRYCFRREFPYAESGATRAGVAAALEAIASDTGVHEVILSGGDPLLVDDDRLAEIVRALERLPHVRRLRIHSRLPIVLPSRVTMGLARLLGGSRLTTVVVVHANHPAELDASVAAAVRRLAASPAMVLNQAVLLAGVNDSVEVQRALSERLVEFGVVPYYLHLLDRVRGAGHFEVEESRAVELHRQLQNSLPGYAVPRLVRETPGAEAKTWIA